ncbi:MerR family transcriptional regulator [Ideonella sp. DXS29W]|uniref:MerR family transcriptional regulator n=1 Tax=Ideonella lacteola TaxID=2984193 RepID=A0ABU9C0B9_9BURK
MLKVGELARRSGLTVRTLHHYDSIGLLQPSARSESGYRLYGDADIERLHAIQALRGMGLSLAEIGPLLGEGDRAQVPALVARQIAQLDEQIERSQRLREQLVLTQTLLARGGRPPPEDWLAGLLLMNTCQQYFSPEETRRLFEDWRRLEADSTALIGEFCQAREGGVPADDIELQPLVRRWMRLTMRWMRGDEAMLDRWRQMRRAHPPTRGGGGLDAPTLHYIEQAVQARLDVLMRYLSPEDIDRLDKTLDDAWDDLVERIMLLVRQGTTPGDPAVRPLVREWFDLMGRLTRHDDALRARLIEAHSREPFLRAGAAMTPAAREFIQQAIAALDPHPT